MFCGVPWVSGLPRSTSTGCPATLPQPSPCTTLPSNHLSSEIQREKAYHIWDLALEMLQHSTIHWATMDVSSAKLFNTKSVLLTATVALVLGTPGTGDSFIHHYSGWSQLLWSLHTPAPSSKSECMLPASCKHRSRLASPGACFLPLLHAHDHALE